MVQEKLNTNPFYPFSPLSREHIVLGWKETFLEPESRRETARKRIHIPLAVISLLKRIELPLTPPSLSLLIIDPEVINEGTVELPADSLNLANFDLVALRNGEEFNQAAILIAHNFFKQASEINPELKINQFVFSQTDQTIIILPGYKS